jgi:putative nucleotidyltransferase with HDIG domain
VVHPGKLRQNSSILLMFVISALPLVATSALLYLSQTTAFPFFSRPVINFMLPLALAPLLATILVDSAAGISLGIWVTLAAGVLGKRDPTIFLVGFVATVVASQVARNVRTRAKVFRIGVLIGLAEILCVVSLAVLQWPPVPIQVLYQALACMAGGIAVAVVTLILLPLVETLFKITTDITLLEFSDLGHPLLQRLAIEAPGTYHHSLVVANLAQAAADDIGANGLLARVCAYYHDVGKLTKPEFFTENIRLQSSPHDDLPPSMSTLVITSHVKEGISLAVLNKLPQPIFDVIQEHHGTGLVRYFHHKAKSQLEFELPKKD